MRMAEVTPVQGLLLRAAMYELLAVGYTYPGAAQRQRVQELAAGLAPWIDLVDPVWSDRLRQFGEHVGAAVAAEMEAEFNRLFSGAMDAVPHETAYDPDIFRKQAALADIAGFYRAFGFQVADGGRWQPDHIGVELEYGAILLQRAARALEHCWEEQVEICADALRKFLLEHLGRWASAFTSDLERQANLPFYQHLARVTREWVEAELAALGLQPDRLRARQVSADDLELPTCGGCTGCGPAGPVAGAPCPLPLKP